MGEAVSGQNIAKHMVSQEPEVAPVSHMNTRRERGIFEPTEGGIYLDPSDPFESACIKIVEMNRKKRQDYALDGDPFSNFHMSVATLGVDNFGPMEAVLFNLAQKFARLQSLRKNGRLDAAANEAAEDTYLDIAVYGVILYSMVLAFKDGSY
ncbi:MAG TPA: hypothetical protein VLN58_02125 [Verrucomicrobiae bacterium]|nr:hypothetical protein [Verrucomicrobiae bacterium]